MCDVKVFLTFTFVVKILQGTRGCWWRWFTIDVPPSSLDLVLRWLLFYLFWSSIVINAAIVTAALLNRHESGRFGAVKSDSTHHFFGNACTKSGSLRFFQFSGCWLILSVYILMSFDIPFGRLFGVGKFCYYPYCILNKVLYICSKSSNVPRWATTMNNYIYHTVRTPAI